MNIMSDSDATLVDEYKFATKTIKQKINRNSDYDKLMSTFIKMMNLAIKIGFLRNESSLKKLSPLCYRMFNVYDVMSYYKICAISQAAGILKKYKGHYKNPIVKKPFLAICYQIKRNDNLLSLPFKKDAAINILLNQYTRYILNQDGIEIRSVIMKKDSISITYRKNIKQIIPQTVIGFDINHKNIIVADKNGVTKMNKAQTIKNNNHRVVKSFKRIDWRIQQKFYSGRFSRSKRCVGHIMHVAVNYIIEQTKKQNAAISCKQLKGISKIYDKKNSRGKGKNFRRNGKNWSYSEFMRYIQYKAEWAGVKVIFVSPYNTSKICCVCGKKTQSNGRNLEYGNCSTTFDRDRNTSVNIQNKVWDRSTRIRYGASEIRDHLFGSMKIIDSSKFALMCASTI